MAEVVNFPLSAYKLSREEEKRLAESSAFPPGFKAEHVCPDPYCETKTVSKKWYEQLKADGVKHYDLKRELEAMSLWDRIFNWPYKEQDDA